MKSQCVGNRSFTPSPGRPGLPCQTLIKRRYLRDVYSSIYSLFYYYLHDILQTALYRYRFFFHAFKNSVFSLAPRPTLFNRPVRPMDSCISVPRTGRWVIRTRMLCFIKLVARQTSVHGAGVGSVMSRGVYLMLQAYIDKCDGTDFGSAGEKVSSARPLVGVVYLLVLPEWMIPLGKWRLFC
jgi:hypothetical protein